MGFFFTLLYFVTYYLTPDVLFGPLAHFRIELIFAALVLIVSLPNLTGSFIFKAPQSLALIGLAIAVFFSMLVGAQWIGGAFQAFLGFVPNAFGFFLVSLHCNSKRKLQILILMLLFVCLFVIAHGAYEEIQAYSAINNINKEISVTLGTPGSYVMAMKSDEGEWFFRLRGQGLINDPNDFGQLTVCVIPLMFFFWRKKSLVNNIFVVLLPVSVLLVGVFLTHSRGALLALMALTIMAARRKIGSIPALGLGAVLFVGAMALHFTGGREISAESGADRTALWGEGMEMLKSHPLFGVGFGQMKDLAENTAHNSIVVCGAELGFIGLFFWSLYLFPTLRDAIAISSSKLVTVGTPTVVDDSPLKKGGWQTEEIDHEEINRLGRLMLMSLTGFLVTGWFLSRAFVLTLFLLGGMAEVVYQMAVRRGMIAPRWKLSRVLPYAGVMALCLVFVMYIMIRTLNLAH
jgi:O-antigen ligase